MYDTVKLNMVGKKVHLKCYQLPKKVQYVLHVSCMGTMYRETNFGCDTIVQIWGKMDGGPNCFSKWLSRNKVPLIDNFCGLITFNSNHACPPKSFVVIYHLPKKLEFFYLLTII